MKSAYELAMERLNKTGPVRKVSAAQKKQLAELDSVYSAKVAERELFLKGEMAKAAGKGEYETLEQLEKQLASDRKSLSSELDAKKDKVRETQE